MGVSLQRSTPPEAGRRHSPAALREQDEMSPPERTTSGTDAPVSRPPSERVAVRRLEAALLEQARVGDLYARSIGTAAEQFAYVRFQAASAKVTECDRQAKAR